MSIFSFILFIYMYVSSLNIHEGLIFSNMHCLPNTVYVPFYIAIRMFVDMYFVLCVRVYMCACVCMYICSYRE